MVRSEELRIRTLAVALPVALAVALVMLMGFGSSPAHADATFTVNSTGDENDLDFPAGVFDGSSDGKCDVSSGVAGDQCTLRAAIQEANLTLAPDTIRFGIPGSGVKTISPNSLLPVITEAVTITGYTQPGSSVNTSAKGTNAKLMIELDGANVDNGSGGGLDIQASNVTVKGLVINGFRFIDSIIISPRTVSDVATNIRIEGNFLGTDPSGTQDVGNGDTGVFIFSGTSNTVGGTSLAARNLISGNNSGGVYMQGDAGYGPSSNNVVQGNLIGTQRDGTSALGNGDNGVTVAGFTSPDTGNRILSNSIAFNENLGIDLGDNGVTANDNLDPDVGPNLRQNFPEVTSATTTRRATTIVGTLNSTPNTTFTLQFFSSPQPDPSGFGEGQTFKVQKSVSTDNGGDGTFSFKLKRGKKIPVGQFVTATATDPQGNTSEFSAAVEVVLP